jgi:hypothetical protein
MEVAEYVDDEINSLWLSSKNDALRLRVRQELNYPHVNSGQKSNKGAYWSG